MNSLPKGARGPKMRFCFAVVAVACSSVALAQPDFSVFSVAVNQAGWRPESPKWCRVTNPPSRDFVVQTVGTDVWWRTVMRGKFVPSGTTNGVFVADISSIVRPGDYRILCGDERENRGGCEGGLPGNFKGVASFHFPVREGVYDNVERMLVQYCTWQRCGHRKGWAGVCHQDPVPVKDIDGTVVRTIDVRGGFHQSSDLRCWHDGISQSIYQLLRYAEQSRPDWDDGEIAENVRWGCDYFLKVIAPAGYVYDCQFVPIGWGPRDYYDVPTSLGGHCNVVMLLARAARLFREKDPDYAAKLLSAARRVYDAIETIPHFATKPKAFVKNLPPGTQQGDSWYGQQFRTSVNGISERCGAALELFRTTDEARFAADAQARGREMVRLQFADGENAGLYRLQEGSDELGLGGCSYCHAVSGYLMPLELFRTFGGDDFRRAALRTAERYVRELQRDDFRPPPPRMSSAWSLTRARYLAMCANVFGRKDLRPFAQRAFDWVLGANPMNASYVEGVGQNQWQRPVFGQFFPSTPQIPGGVLHYFGGEYDMPPVTQALWTIAELKGANE